MDQGKQNHESSVLLRALDILEFFSNEQREVQTIGNIRQNTGLPAATVHRILRVLCTWGAVEKVDRGRYRLGVKLWQIGSSAPYTRYLRDAALPYLEDLYAATRSVVHLAVADDVHTLYIEKIEGHNTVPVTSVVGRKLPLHATGPGKVLLAYGTPELFDAVIENGLERLTPRTITTESELRRALAEIRRTGYARSVGEASTGTASVAVPVFRGNQGPIVASISVVNNDSSEPPLDMVMAMKAVARSVSRRIATLPTVELLG